MTTASANRKGKVIRRSKRYKAAAAAAGAARAVSIAEASTRVLALCAAGKTSDARAAAQDFLAKYPRSPSAPRIRASCGAPAP